MHHLVNRTFFFIEGRYLGRDLLWIGKSAFDENVMRLNGPEILEIIIPSTIVLLSSKKAQDTNNGQIMQARVPRAPTIATTPFLASIRVW